MATAAKPTTIRVDENLKAQANEILGSVGLSYNTYVVMATHQLVNQCSCLLYTSDAADE